MDAYKKRCDIVMKRKCFILCIMCLIYIFTVSAAAMAENKNDLKENDLIAKSAVLIDGESGRVLFGKNYDKKMAMASTTKIMTCIVALENAPEDKIVEISSKAAGMPRVRMNVIKGEKYILKDLLYAMMLESYNDVAVAVAEGVAGSMENFAKLMNNKAKEIGAENTNFVTPNGLDAKGHMSTAYDMALIGAYAVKNKRFLEIVNTKSYNLSNMAEKRNFTAVNKNAFLTMENDAVGIKTGFTGEAGYCFVGAVKSKGRTFVSCVLACGWPPNKTYKWNDTKKLMNYGKSNYKYKEIIKGEPMVYVNIVNGTKNKISARVEGKYSALISKKDIVKKDTKISYKLPIKKDSSIGEVDILINDGCVKKCKLIAMESVEEYNYMYCLKKTLEYFIFQ